MKPKPAVVDVALDPAGGKGEFRKIGGAQDDRWNMRLLRQLVSALPEMTRASSDAARDAAITATAAGLGELKPNDPVEAMLVSQMMTANAAAHELYRCAWLPEQPFEVSTRYIALADKAARTVAVLTEALDRHRGRGQQHITVKHITVNADQAVVAEHVNGVGGLGTKTGDQPHAKLRHAPGLEMPCQVEAERSPVPGASGSGA